MRGCQLGTWGKERDNMIPTEECMKKAQGKGDNVIRTERSTL